MNYDKLFETEDIVIEDEKGKKNIKTVVSPKYKDSTKKQIPIVFYIASFDWNIVGVSLNKHVDIFVFL